MLDIGKLRPVQAMAAASLWKHRRLMFAGPRQYTGKTELGVQLLEDLTCRPYTSSALFIAKDHPSAKKATREKFMRVFDPKLFEVNTELVYLKKCPSSAVFMASVDKDPARNRGGTYRFIHWTEVAFSQIQAGETITGVFDKIFAPTLTSPLMDGDNGFAYLESTMNGKNGWKDLWDNAKSFGFQTLRVSLSQMMELGLVSPEVYGEQKASTHPDVFRQEYECEWVTFAGRAYWEFGEQHIDADLPGPAHWQKVASGIDWGWSPSANCVLFGYIENGVICVFDEHYAMQEVLETTAHHIRSKLTAWDIGPERYAAVADHENDRIEELNRRGIMCTTANKSNVLGVRQQIKELMWHGKLKVHPRCVHLIKDLEAATWNPKKEGELDDAQCSWGHFDAEAALRYLVRELSSMEAAKPAEDPHRGADPVSSAAWHMERRTPDDNAWGNRW